MINKFRISVVLIAMLGLLQITCKKPNTGLTFNIRSDVMKYTVLVRFVDPTTGAAPTGMHQLSITGDNASEIYEISGSKSFTVLGGQIPLGLDPNTVPAAGVPKKFNIVAVADGYLSVNIPVVMRENNFQQIITVNMVNLAHPPAGVSVVSKHFTLVNGQLPAAVSLATPATNGKVDSISLSLPAGLKFYDANNVQLTGSNVFVQVVHFDNRAQTSLSCFPGGGNPISSNIKDASGAITSGFFTTLGYSDIYMSVGSTEVRNFNDSVRMTMTLNDTTNDLSTGAHITTGSTLKVHSYRVETGQWQYEANRPVESSGSRLVIKHATTHLTTYTFGFLTDVCSNPPPLTITYAPGNTQQFTGIIHLKNIPADDNNNYAVSDITISGQSFPISVYLPYAVSGTSVTRASFYDANGVTTSSLCSAATLDLTGIAFQTLVTAVIKGTCANDPTKIVSPSFYVDYRLHGSSDNYQLLGFVSYGHFSTPAVLVGQTYDLRAVFAGQLIETTQVISQANNTATVDMSSTSFCQQ